MPGFPKNQPHELEPIPATVEEDGKKLGPPFYKPLDGEHRAVWIAAACGIPQDEIAKHMNDGKGIAKHTLQKHFRKELNEGMWEANLKAAGTLLDTMQNCKDLKVKQRANEFWLERRMGWVNAHQPQNTAQELVIKVEGGFKTTPKE